MMVLLSVSIATVVYWYEFMKYSNLNHSVLFINNNSCVYCLSVSLPVCLSVYQSVYQSVRLSVSLSACLSACLPLCRFWNTLDPLRSFVLSRFRFSFSQRQNAVYFQSTNGKRNKLIVLICNSLKS